MKVAVCASLALCLVACNTISQRDQNSLEKRGLVWAKVNSKIVNLELNDHRGQRYFFAGSISLLDQTSQTIAVNIDASGINGWIKKHLDGTFSVNGFAGMPSGNVTFLNSTTAEVRFENETSGTARIYGKFSEKERALVAFAASSAVMILEVNRENPYDTKVNCWHIVALKRHGFGVTTANRNENGDCPAFPNHLANKSENRFSK